MRRVPGWKHGFRKLLRVSSFQLDIVLVPLVGRAVSVRSNAVTFIVHLFEAQQAEALVPDKRAPSPSLLNESSPVLFWKTAEMIEPSSDFSFFSPASGI